MPYVQRDIEGRICGVYANLQPGYAEEFLDDNDPAVLAFLNPPPPVPSSISDRQFFQQLAFEGIITEDDALASNAAVIPPPLLAIIDGMPASQQFAAKMLVSGATVFQRNHPMTLAIGAAYGWNAAQIDAFFQSAAAL
jgi:hypothetical protein